MAQPDELSPEEQAELEALRGGQYQFSDRRVDPYSPKPAEYGSGAVEDAAPMVPSEEGFRKDLELGAGIGGSRVIGRMLSRVGGNSLPMQAAKFGLSAVGGANVVEAIEAAPSVISQGWDRLTNSKRANEGFLDSAASITKDIETASIGKVAEVAGGRVIEGTMAALGDKFLSKPRDFIREKATREAVKSLNFNMGAIHDIELTEQNRITSPLLNSAKRLMDNGIDLASGETALYSQIKQKERELGAQLASIYNKQTRQGVFAANAVPGSPGWEQTSNYYKNKFLEKAAVVRGQITDKTKIPDFDEAIARTASKIDESLAIGRSMDPNYQLNIKDVHNVKSWQYSQDKYNKMSVPDNSVKMDRESGRILKELIEDELEGSPLADVNRLYGDLQEVGSALENGPLRKLIRGDQMGFSATVSNTMAPMAFGMMASQNIQNPTPEKTAVSMMVAPMVFAAVTGSAAGRRQISNLLQQFAKQGVPSDMASAYITNNITQAISAYAVNTPIPRQSNADIAPELAASRVAAAMAEAGLPPEIAIQEGIRVTNGLRSRSPIARKNALLEISKITPDALEETGEGYSSVIDGKFNDPLEQSHYLKKVTFGSGDLAEEAKLVGQALSGSYYEEEKPTATPYQPMQYQAPIDMENIEGAFSMPSYQGPVSATSNPEEEDPVARMNRLAVGSDRQAY
jgi:hypothetical protein